GWDGVVDEAVDDAAGIGDAVDRQRLGRSADQQAEERQQQENRLPAARLRADDSADRHGRPRSTRDGRDRGSPLWGLDSGGPAVVGPSQGPLDRLTLRRHLSMALPLSESLPIRFAASSSPPVALLSASHAGLTPPAGSRSGTRSSGPGRLPSRRN